MVQVISCWLVSLTLVSICGCVDSTSSRGGAANSDPNGQAASSIDAFERTLNGDPDPLTLAVIQEIERDFAPEELAYLKRLSWEEHADTLLEDPIMLKLLASIARHAKETGDPVRRQALVACDDDEDGPTERLRRRFRLNCFNRPDIALIPTGTIGNATIAGAYGTLVTRQTAADESITTADAAVNLANCNEPGELADPASYGVQTDQCVADSCVTATNVVRGDACNSSSSTRLYFENVCDEEVAILYCLERSDGSWDCGIDHLDPGEESAGLFTCQGTGMYSLRAIPESLYYTDCRDFWSN